MLYSYPENPSAVPENLTEVHRSYKSKVVLAILGILLFYLCYFGMLFGFSYFTYYMFNSFMNDGTLWELAGAVGGLMLVLFTLKFLFKFNKFQDKVSVEITAKNHPKLYAFIHRIAKDTNGPIPNKILVNHDVNACVFFNSTLLSLFFPQKKNLLIGLGLVNGLNLTEFKAVMAHEFGHFSQSSMQVGSYVYMANQIIHDMIFERDKWDDILAMWRGIDIRISFIAWIITPFIWLVRQLMFLIYKMINLLHSSLSREMEFHADKVAVSVSGSDAIINALWKLEKAFSSWDATLSYTGTAASQKIYSGNLFLHQKTMLEQQQEAMQKEIDARESDEDGVPVVFKEEETYSSLDMYASHPANKDREENAKRPYVSGTVDETSPWILFEEPEKIQEEITQKLYLNFMQLKPAEYIPDTKKMTAFIAQEKSTEQVFGEEYMGSFNERYLNLPELSEIQPNGEDISPDEIRDRFETLVREELPKLMQPIKEINEKYQELALISNGAKKIKEFEYKGTKYKKKNLNDAVECMVKDRDDLLHAPFADWDREMLRLSLAALDVENRKVQIIRIKMLDHFQKDLKSIVGKNNAVHSHFTRLAEKGDVTDSDIKGLTMTVNGLVDHVRSLRDGNKEMLFTPLPNIETLDELLDMLGNNELKKVNSKSFNNGEFQTLTANVDILINNYNRLIFKLISFLIRPLEDLKKESVVVN
ncbi:M48 family metallopeptidase [Sungkyunkwania multivorans]|uniref:M48 family metallopeptidase n=1 Tax=Sungkyunkwania multivorans TaxID=1173618 RepID=A0ABW3CX56_9FLAO